MTTYHQGGTADQKWWQKAVFYQVYPRSFQDSDGDGIGDLQGILDRIDYFVALGVDAIWISPFYPSPMVDFGYDVSDYIDVDPMFGDLETFDRLLAAAHQRDLKIILDFVPNHSSNQHRWFIESRSSRDNPKRDWYIWKDGREDGSPPNNWQAQFGGSVWQWDAPTEQYYMHSFLPEQPDLNWRNPEVVEAMHNVLRFWLDRGVDGFRVDAIIFLMKDEQFRDNPPIQPGSHWGSWGHDLEPVHCVHLPETIHQIRGMRRVLDEYEDRVHIGETVTHTFAELLPYYGAPLDGYHIPFNFATLDMPWDAARMRALVEEYYGALPPGGWPNFVFGNHDRHRLATRFGQENHRSAAMLLLTLWGIPTMYYGDELGMADVFIPTEECIDPWGLNKPETDLGRDPERTPMQWDSSANAGFTTGQPWLPLAPNCNQINVATSSADPHSTLNFYKRLLRLRRELPALYNGSFTFVDGLAQDVLAYVRESGGQRLLVVVNFGPHQLDLDLTPVTGAVETLLSSRFTDHDDPQLRLQGHESVLLKIG